MAVSTVTQAYLNSNVAYFEIPKGPELQVGQTVTIAGCTTGTFNAALTVLTNGLFEIPGQNPSQPDLWSGFSATLVHANIAREVEPATATATV
jgi:hypothetical protein